MVSPISCSTSAYANLNHIRWHPSWISALTEKRGRLGGIDIFSTLKISVQKAFCLIFLIMNSFETFNTFSGPLVSSWICSIFTGLSHEKQKWKYPTKMTISKYKSNTINCTICNGSHHGYFILIKNANRSFHCSLDSVAPKLQNILQW